MDKLAEFLLWYLAFLLSTVLHEAAHAFVAYRLGDRTAYEGGQLTLDPIPHIKREPIGTIAVPIISFLLGGWMIGWASVPYNAQWAYDNPRSSAKMSVAGPAANLLLALLAALVIRVGIMCNIFSTPESINYAHVIDATQEGVLSTLAMFINVFFSLNLLLFIFNLLPIPPLDGSGIVQFFMSDETAQHYFEFVENRSVAFIGIIVAWNIFEFIYDPLHLTFINMLFYPIAHYE